MTAISLDESSVAVVAAALREVLPHVGPCHLSEALAASLRRRTHASLRSDLRAHQDDPPIQLIDSTLFHTRLRQLGYSYQPVCDHIFEFLPDADLDTELIETTDAHARSIEYNNDRKRAWRNLLVSAINEALRLRLFSLRPDDDRWANADKGEGVTYDFTLINGLPARGYVEPIGYAELSVHVAVNPKKDGVRDYLAGFSAGDAFARGWLERERGAWLQSATKLFNCRKNLLSVLAAMAVEPHGYGDRGRVIW